MAELLAILGALLAGVAIGGACRWIGCDLGSRAERRRLRELEARLLSRGGRG